MISYTNEAHETVVVQDAPHEARVLTITTKERGVNVLTMTREEADLVRMALSVHSEARSEDA